MSSIGDFASGVWVDLGSPSNVSIVSISGWSEVNIGGLNIKIDTSFSISGDDFSPSFGTTESSIYEQMYKIQYFEQRTYEAINGIFDESTMDWSNLSEGDSKITRTNRGELLKLYRGMQRDAQLELDKCVGYYKSNLANPIQVAGDDAPSSPVLN